MSALLTSRLPGLSPPVSKGKVREMYDLGEHLLIVTTDRISAFDVVMANGIPDKGRVLNQLSAFWFTLLRDICPHHMVSADPTEAGEDELKGRCMMVLKARPLPIECVARGYIAGSLFKEYKQVGPNVHELGLPSNLSDSDKLPEPIFTPATKAHAGHDENLSWRAAVNLVGQEVAEKVRDWTLRLYSEAAKFAAGKGLILADTKFEFGETDDGIIWIDEALTPDSSRYWDVSHYRPGGSQPSFDKQFVRDYLESIGWDKQPPGPTLPPDVVTKTREKYLAAFRRLTGTDPAGIP